MSPCPHLFRIPLLLAALGLGPASAAPPPKPGTVLELQPIVYNKVADWQKDFTHLLAKDLGNRQADFQKFGLETMFQRMITFNLGKMVPSRGLKYASIDSKGRPRIYSGRVFFPSRDGGGPATKLPLVIYQHATETERKYAPYFDRGDEVVFGGLGAQLCGFAVAMPDGDGMGADPSPEPHAYCHGATNAPCLLDMIRACLDTTPGKKVFDGTHYAWDGRVFIMGYSEAGYIALAAVKELATNPAYKDIKLTGAACMGGPLDFSNTVRKLLSDARTPYPRPYIPAYFISTWQRLYPDDISMAKDLNPKLLEEHQAKAGSPDKDSAVEWMNGELNGDKITHLIQFRLTGRKDQHVPARTIAREDWVRANLDQPSSRLNQLLKQNDILGKWVPPAPVLMTHDPNDECVPYSNTAAAFDNWKKQGADPCPIVRLEARGKGSGHVGGAVLSIPMAFIWFKAGMPRAPMEITLDTLAKAAKDHVVSKVKEHASRLYNALPSLPGR